MQCSSCHHPNTPSSRFCGACGAALSESAVASAPCLGCGHLFPTAQKFCGACGHKRDAVSRAARISRPAPAPEAALSELKIVTVLFSDMCGFTSLSERLDTEELRDLMNGWFDRLSKLIPTFGGTIDKFIGDAVMALFGAPIAHDNDPKRAIDAALAMQEELENYNHEVAKHIGQPLRIRIGINTGRVYAGMLGGESHRSYTVMGDAVNVASRLESACPVGSILISESTHEHVRGIYNFREQAPLSVKGKSEPLATVEILGRRTAAARTQMSEDGWATAGVCRVQELIDLKALFKEVATSNTPKLVAVIGESGMGKNQFSNQFALSFASEELGSSLSTHCDAGVGASPFQVLIDLLSDASEVSSGSASQMDSERFERYLQRTLAGSSEARTESIRVLGHLMGLRAGVLNAPANLGDPSAMHHATLAAARQWLLGLADAGPIFLRIHNLHNAPDATFDLLSFLADTEELPLLLLFTLGPEASALSSALIKRAAQLQLAPLDIDTSRHVASHLLRSMTSIPVALVNMLAERSGGNPGFIEESVRSLLAQGTLLVDNKSNTWRLRDDKLPASLSIPDTVSRMIAVRVDRLSPEGKQVLQWAAVAGPRFDAKHLAALADSDDIEELAHIENALREALEAGLLAGASHTAQRQGEFRFRPALVRDEVYETVVAKTRRQWHQRYADWLRADSAELNTAQLETIAHHLLGAGRGSEAAKLFRQAGDAAAAIYANEDARRHYQHAREALQASECEANELADLLYCLAQVLALAGDYDGVEHVCGEAIEILADSDPTMRASLEVRRGRSFDALGRRDLARNSYMQAILLASQGSDEDSRVALADAQQNLGWADYRDGDLENAESLLREALSSLEGIEAPALLARCKIAMAGLYRVRGRTDEAISELRDSLRLQQACEDRSTMGSSYLSLGVVYFDRGDYVEARNAYSEGMQIHRARGNADGIALSLLNISGAELELGSIEDALASVRQATNLAMKIKAWYTPECFRCHAEVAILAKDLTRARQLIEQGMALLVTATPITLRGNLLSTLGLVDLECEDWASARAHLTQALEAHETSRNSHEIAVTTTRLGRLAIAERRPEEARKLFLRAQAYFVEAGNAVWTGRCGDALALLC